jgi:RimJ/RimL family protein N-acetyltransferase
MTSPLLPIETERLILRTFTKNDIDAVADYHSLPDVQRYLDWKARDRVELKAAIEVMRKQVAINRPGDTMSLAVERKTDRKVTGHVALRWYDATASQAELRFVFNPVYRRQGYATEAVRAAVTLGFDVFNFHRIFGRCDARNTASARLMRGLGMRLEAHYREHAMFQGEWDEELHFAILDREWRRSPKVRDLPVHRVA